MRLIPPSILLVSILGLSGCGQSTAPTPSVSSAAGPAATVILKDGTSFAGSVTKSDTSAITVQSMSGEARTYPMAQVASVNYGAAPVPQPVTAALPPAPAPVEVNNSGAINQSREIPPPPPMAPRPMEEFRTIPAGTNLEVRNNSAINSDTAAQGQTYSGVVARDVLDTQGRVAIPRGSNATLVVRAVSDQGKVQGRSELVLDVGSVAVAGRNYRLDTRDVVERGTEGLGENKRTGVFVGGGAALGGIIGAIAGGGKGAAIGALSGAGAGTATQAMTRGKAVHVPSETILSFRLDAPVHIHEMR